MSACKDVNWGFRPIALDGSESNDYQANLIASGMGILVAGRWVMLKRARSREAPTDCLNADAAYKDSAR